MESKKINQLATELTPVLSDITIIGDPTTGISKKITLSQMASLFTGTVEEYPNFAAFPLVGTADTIYIALDTNVLYRYDTGLNAYVELSPNIISNLVFGDANGFDGTISLVGSTATLTITTALTTGSVPFIGASGALLQDNANLFWNNSTKRLGINTNAPTTALDAFGSGIIGRLNGTSTNNAFLGFASAGTNKWSIGNVQSDHRFRIYSEANTAELVSVLQTGEFGIGIANPLTKLHIFGGATALIANLDANVSVAKSISFRSGNSSRINLEVSGTESGSNAGANFFIRTYSDAGSLLATPLTITRSTGDATFSNNITATGGFINGATDAFFHINRSASGNAARIRFQTAGTTDFQIGLVGGLSGLRILNSTGTTAFTLLESGEATFINNTFITDGYYISTRTDNTTVPRIGFMMRRGDGSGTYADIFTTGNTANGVGSIQFGFNSSPKMILTDGGNLTLGDYTPTDTFGTGRVIDIGSADGGSIVIRDTTNPTTQYGGMSYNGNTDNGLRMWSNGFFGVNLSGVRKFTIANSGDITLLNNAAIFFGGASLTYLAGGDNQMTFGVNNAVAMNINSLRQIRMNGFVPGYDGSSALLQINGFARINGQIFFHNPSSPVQEVGVSCIGAASFYVAGALSKASGSFRIDHPLESMNETHQLVHSFVEAPQADLYYRGKLKLINGKGQANIDEVATMTEGTFEALCREVQCFTTNETGWDLVKGKVIGNIIYIESQNTNSTDEISWLVIGERKDKHMMDTDWTDENGRVIVEPLKPIKEETEKLF